MPEVDGQHGDPVEVHRAFSAVHSVIPDMNDPAKRIDKVSLCRVSGLRAFDGMCPVHDSDACLSLFVRFNYLMEITERELKAAALRVRQRV